MFYLQSLHSQMYAEVKDGSNQEGTSVVLNPFNGKCSQMWVYENGAICNKPSRSDLVMTVREADEKIVMSRYRSAAEQTWIFEDDYTVQNGNKAVLDVREGSKNPGTELIVFRKHGGSNQKFRVVPIEIEKICIPPTSQDSEMPFYLQCLNSFKCVEAREVAVMAQFTGRTNQQWIYTQGRIQNKRSGRFLTIENGLHRKIILSEARASGGQTWKLNPDGTISAEDGKVLDVSCNSVSEGATLIAYQRNGDKNQLFMLRFVGMMKKNRLPIQQLAALALGNSD
ncbi:uncharacterized protein [Periplaneta americana]|uniref:uncharacterized protein n=1 Tax=Periplaneta americana TaxID=6978 RepID=UPI0037E95A0B